MSLSILDIFLLTMFDRGAQSPYDLQRGAGISLGASVPSLRRLTASKLVSWEEGRAATNRPRHEYRLTASGKAAARTAWKPFFEADDTPADIDSILRLVDMAAHYGADKRNIRAFLKRAAEAKSLMAKQAGLSSKATREADKVSYTGMRIRCDASRLEAEAETLRRIGELFRPKAPVEGR